MMRDKIVQFIILGEGEGVLENLSHYIFGAIILTSSYRVSLE